MPAMSTSEEPIQSRVRRRLLAWLALSIGWAGAGAAYGLYVAVRMDLWQRAADCLMLMFWVGSFFGLLGGALTGLRGAVRLGLGCLAAPRRSAPERSMAASALAGVGGFALVWAVLLCAGDLFVSLAFEPDGAGAWLAARIGLALSFGAGLCWLLAGPLARRLDGWLVWLRDPHGLRVALVLAGLGLAGAALMPLGAPTPQASARRPSGPPAGLAVEQAGLRLLIVGLDGASWRVVSTLVEAGSMPQLARLIEQGAIGTPLSAPPRASPITWTSIVTGQPPERHGVREYLLVSLPGVRPFPFESLAHHPSVLPFSFVALAYFAPGLAEGIPPTSDRVRTRSLWHMLSDAGLRSLVLGMPCTWPARPVAGLLVSDRFGPNEFDMFSHQRGPPPDRFWPPEAEARLNGLAVDSGGDAAPMLRKLAGFDEAQVAELAAWSHNPVVTSPLKLLNEVHDADSTFLEILKAELPGGSYQLAVVLLNSLDLAMHAFWAERFPEDFGLAQASRPAWGRLIDAFHNWIDQQLAEVLSLAGPDTVVFIVSDSGMEASPGNPVWPGWHAERALFIAAGGPIRAGVRLEAISYLDLVPSALYLLGLPVGEDLPGRVLSEMIDPEYLARRPVRTIATWE